MAEIAIKADLSELIEELKEYEHLSLSDLKDNADFRNIYVKTKIGNYLRVDETYNNIIHYFENLKSNPEYIEKLGHLISIKNQLVDLIDKNALDEWNHKYQQEVFKTIIKKINAHTLDNPPADFLDLVNKLLMSKNSRSFDKITNEIYQILINAIGYNDNILASLDYLRSRLWYLNICLYGGYNNKIKPLKAKDVVNIFKAQYYTRLNPKKEKEAFIKYINGDYSRNLQSTLYDRLYLLQSIVEGFKNHGLVKDISLVEDLLDQYNESLDAIGDYFKKVPENLLFKYFYELDEAINFNDFSNNVYKAVKEVLNILKKKTESAIGDLDEVIEQPQSKPESLEQQIKAKNSVVSVKINSKNILLNSKRLLTDRCCVYNYIVLMKETKQASYKELFTCNTLPPTEKAAISKINKKAKKIMNDNCFWILKQGELKGNAYTGQRGYILNPSIKFY